MKRGTLRSTDEPPEAWERRPRQRDVDDESLEPRRRYRRRAKRAEGDEAAPSAPSDDRAREPSEGPRRYRRRAKPVKVDEAAPPPLSDDRAQLELKGGKGRRFPQRGKRYGPAVRAEVLGFTEDNTQEAAAAQFKVSIDSVRRWTRKAERERERDPATVQPEDKQTPEEAILAEWREHPGFGPSQIRNQLKRSRQLKASVTTVRNVMEDHGYVAPKAKQREHVGRYEAARPRELYHLDFVHFYVHKQKQCLLFIEDDFSRFIVGWALVEVEAADPVIQTFERCVERYGKPEAVMSDRGSAFHSWRGLSRFEKLLEEYGIDFYLAREAAVNGKVEALNASFQKELTSKIEFSDLTDAARKTSAWIDHYNHQRTHHSLGGILVPADRFYGLSERTLKMVEQGNGAHALDLLNPDNRGLEIFRVTSHGGKAEVFLMGKKIYG